MKYLKLLVLSFALICFFNSSFAQTLSKAQKKALKKEIKTYKKNPEKWVRLKNNHKEEVDLLEATVEDLRAKLETERNEKSSIEAKNIELAQKYAELETKYLTLKKNAASTQLPEGKVYQVQMGYYQYLDLLSFNEKLKVIKAEEVDGAKRYMIGHFDNLLDAVQFSNDIKKLGIDDAFVTEYIDGERNVNFDALKVLEQ